MKNGDTAAMPVPMTEFIKEVIVEEINGNTRPFNKVMEAFAGLTKREYFAAMAMIGISTMDGYASHSDKAVDAVRSADALLAELEKTKCAE